MPGVEFVEGSSGLDENPGGRAFVSVITTLLFVLAEFVVLTSTAVLQPMPKLNATIEGINNLFITINITSGV